MTNKPPVACTQPGCKAYAIQHSIYCEAHQTKDSHGNRDRAKEAKPTRKDGRQYVAVEDTKAAAEFEKRFYDEDLSDVLDAAKRIK